MSNRRKTRKPRPPRTVHQVHRTSLATRPWRDDQRLSARAKQLMDFMFDQAGPDGVVKTDEAFFAAAAAKFGMPVEDAREVFR